MYGHPLAAWLLSVAMYLIPLRTSFRAKLIVLRVCCSVLECLRLRPVDASARRMGRCAVLSYPLREAHFRSNRRNLARPQSSVIAAHEGILPTRSSLPVRHRYVSQDEGKAAGAVGG
jgi:hypothetical protein